MQTKRFLSLRVQAVLAVLVGLLLGGAVFTATLVGLQSGVDRVYLSAQAIERRYERHLDDLRAYVEMHGLSSDDRAAVLDWCPRGVHLLVYRDGQLLFSDLPADSSLASVQATPQNAVAFSDGICHVTLLDYTGGWLYNLSLVAALAAGCLTLILVVILYNGRLEQDVLRLSGEIAKIGAGNLEQHVTVRGRSEMTQLQRSVDEMRQSLQEKIQNEERAWRSNRDLITSLSHDLRSPLTALIGYLELIRDGQPDGEGRQYADACMAKALQLKTMSDELFRYFLVYDEAKLNLRPERYDAAALLGQMLGEQVLLAQEQGLRFRLSMPQKLGDILADPQFLQRLFDNLFSNLQKYADPEKEIVISVTRPAGKIQIVLHNAIRALPEKPESSGIGLSTCRRIVEAMHGTFRTATARGVYTTTIRLLGLPKNSTV